MAGLFHLRDKCRQRVGKETFYQSDIPRNLRKLIYFEAGIPVVPTIFGKTVEAIEANDFIVRKRLGEGTY